MTTSNNTPSVALKSIYAAIMKDNANSTLTTKKMRARLRVEHKDSHLHNSSWVFTESDADRVRALFDPAFAKRLEQRAKRATKVTKPRKAKVEVAQEEPVSE